MYLHMVLTRQAKGVPLYTLTHFLQCVLPYVGPYTTIHSLLCESCLSLGSNYTVIMIPYTLMYMYLDVALLLCVCLSFSCLLTRIVTQPHIATQRHIPLPRYS